MSDMAEYYQEERDKKQKENSARLKWNTDVVYFGAEDYGYEVKQHTEFHLSLSHPKKGRLDFWPSTGKAALFDKKGRQQKAFKVNDVEKFIKETFGR